ncbi:MAG TPA: RIP metalloprotease RseP [Rickettsia endosymbiont of Columbicola hoogstraali]|nr:RIP metalloprotease RseP [Rickettsia endosymbiont of Columbicola hoogstraali]
MLSIVGFIITISILVFIHELGHYAVARFFNVKIEEFSIGFSKELISITDLKGVRWKICLLPLGGYVKIYGYDRNIMDKAQEINEKVAFYAKSCFERFLIVAAGPLINYLLATIIFAGFYFCLGKVEIQPVIGEVIAESPAEKANLQEGDRIVKVNNKLIKDFRDVQKEILINGLNSSTLLIERKGEEFTVSIMPEEVVVEKARKILRIGIMAKNEPVHTKIGILSSLSEAIFDTIDISAVTLKAASQMIVGKRSVSEIGGPVAIAKESGRTLEHSIEMYLLFIAMLSVNLGLLNLLPIPVLDGGHLVFILYEAVTGKLPNIKARNILLQIGIIIIIFLTVISFSNDIKNLFS